MPGFGKGKATKLQLASRLAAGFNSSTRITLTTPVVLSLLKRTLGIPFQRNLTNVKTTDN